MFSLKRLFSRKEILDDAETAFVEGRSTEAEVDEMWRNGGVSPERLAELESLRATVGLLRRVQPEMAPRSFALAQAPEFARRRSARAAFAPAMAAIIAVFGVALLSIGSLTGYVTQSGQSPAEDQGLVTAGKSNTWAELTGPQGATGPAGATATNEASGQPAPVPTAPAAVATSPASLAPADSGYGMTEEQLRAMEATATADASTPSFSGGTVDQTNGSHLTVTVAPVDTSSNDASAGSLNGTEIAPSTFSPSTALTTPTLEPAENLSATESNGFELPIWQLQVSLAGLAALMVAAWAYIRHRSNA